MNHCARVSWIRNLRGVLAVLEDLFPAILAGELREVINVGDAFADLEISLLT